MITYALIVAGGSGSRMGSDIPKQFLLLKGRPVLMQTIDVFFQSGYGQNIIVVLPEREISEWKRLCELYQFAIPHSIVAGGNTRTESVINGLNKVPAQAIVAVHDGVRPLVSKQLIRNCFEAAELNDSAIPCIAVTDSIRLVKEDQNEPVQRENLRIIQTPQCFKAGMLKAAYENSKGKSFTDDATVFESAGHKIHLIEGERFNIKITYWEDLEIAKSLLESRKW